MREEALPEPLQGDVSKLLRQGEHAAAAAALWAAGHPRRAGAIYQQIFEHEKALAAFEAGGDLAGAVRAALALSDGPSVDRLVGLAMARGQGDALLPQLQRTGASAAALAVAGRIHMARGDRLAAAAAFENAGALDRSAMCLEQAGDVRAAGLLLERHLAEQPGDGDASLSLGRILARFGRHDEGIALLQRAVAASLVPDVMLARAAPTLMMSFMQLGYESAARAVLVRWQQAHARRLQQQSAPPLHTETPPSTFDSFMGSDRAAALAAIQSARPHSTSSAPATPDEMSALVDGTATAADALLLAGRYLLGEPLGGGGGGAQAFRAHDAFADRPVVVKIFGGQVLASEAVQAFARDARAFANLQHPAAAPLVELNLAQGFVVTDFVDAPPLEQRMRQGGESGWLVPAVRALLDLLATCHRTGLVHGGLKPSNVFLLSNGVRVIDLGAHRLLALRNTETGGLASVWPYLSPEQLFGAAAIAASDLYALAAIIYRAFTGVAPFARAEDDRRCSPRRPSSLNPSLPPAWDELLSRALHADPAKRFADAAELAAALPPLPVGFLLPPAMALGGATTDAGPLVEASRYQKGALVQRDVGSVRVYQGTDLLVQRSVWLVEADDMSALRTLVVVARLWRGVQPIYDVSPEAHRVVVARDPSDATADLAALRAVPQGLMRDLAGVARALEWLHGQGLCLGGFPLERALGPVGPRLRFAPAPLPLEASNDGVEADWTSFAALVDHALDLSEDATLDGRGRVLAMLHDRRLLDRNDIEALGKDVDALARWPEFLEATTVRLVRGASARTIARLVTDVVRGH